MANVATGAYQLAEQVMNAFDDYHNAMMAQMQAGDDLRAAEVDLEATQDAVILNTEWPLDGKNAEVRGAQLRGRTEHQYLAHRAAESQYTRARMVTTDRHELLKTLRAISSLLSETSHA
jgi:hypothetical protein